MIEKMLVRMPSGLKAMLRQESERMGITMNALILQILWGWVRDKEVS